MSIFMMVQVFDYYRIISDLETTLANIVRQENFTNLTVFQENITLIAERVCEHAGADFCHYYFFIFLLSLG